MAFSRQHAGWLLPAVRSRVQRPPGPAPAEFSSDSRGAPASPEVPAGNSWRRTRLWLTPGRVCHSQARLTGPARPPADGVSAARAVPVMQHFKCPQDTALIHQTARRDHNWECLFFVLLFQTCLLRDGDLTQGGCEPKSMPVAQPWRKEQPSGRTHLQLQLIVVDRCLLPS